MARALQAHYGNVYSKPRFPSVKEAICKWTGPDRDKTLEKVDVSSALIVEAMKQLSERAAPGPDGVPAILLRRCSSSLSVPLSVLWTVSMESGKVPGILKEGIITPVFKGGNRSDCADYRPIVLTSHVAKTFERVIVERLLRHLEECELMNPNQHGFRRGRSCTSQLLQHYYNVIRVLESGRDVDVVYLDFSKAFDKVDLGVLLLKLRGMGIKGALLSWLQAFLIGRRHRVSVDGHLSDWGQVISGVPQGTHRIRPNPLPCACARYRC